MINFNTVVPGVNQALHTGGAGKPALRPEKQAAETQHHQDGVSLTGLNAPPENSTQPSIQRPAKLGETGLATALQSLPSEAQVARLLNSEPAPMSEAQRDACLGDLSVLDMAGHLKLVDPHTLKERKCSPEQGVECMASGVPIYYRAGRDGPFVEVSGLQSLSDLARQTLMGRVG